MELIRGIHNIRQRHRGCVLTIGNFDGVHLGHQKVIQQVVHQAKKMGLPAVVMTFEPQPREFFTQLALMQKQLPVMKTPFAHQAPARLTGLREKYQQLEKLGVDRLVVVQFNRAFAKMTAHDFVHHVLVEQLGVKFLVVGDDFCFGAERQGNFAYLENAAQSADFTVVNTQSFIVAKQRVSSTAIRDALAHGQVQLAQTLLGRPYRLSGRVSHGNKLGRTLGFPTANVALKRLVSPVAGVYVVRVVGIDKEQSFGGVANIGTRPTLNGDACPQLEVHIFDFDENIYGRYIHVQLLHKLRDEKKFGSLDELTTQINLDAQAARTWLLEFNNSYTQ